MAHLNLFIQPSRLLWWILGFVSLASVAALSLLLAQWPHRAVVLVVFVVGGGLILLLRFGRQQSAYHLRLGQSGILTQLSRDQNVIREWEIKWIDRCVIWTYLLAFRVVDLNGQSHHCLVLPDSVNAQEFRRLKVFLKWERRRFFDQ